jgi:ATP diphosphatase
MVRLVEIMAQLRDPVSGCDWDVAQDFASIAPYTIEEAHEVADAIAENDMAALKEELGDLLLQVVFHARMAEEAGHFALGDVIAGICAKMERRHPHIFGAAEERPDWETMKAEERAEKASSSYLDGVARGLPALLRARKLQARAARAGFDWPDVVPVRDKLLEELAEFESAEGADDKLEEAGDLLFVLVNLLRHHGIEAETALRLGNAKFERRFRAMEAMAPVGLEQLSLEAQDRLWDKVKDDEKKRR